MNNIETHARPAISKEVAALHPKGSEPYKQMVNEQWELMEGRITKIITAYTEEEMQELWSEFKREYSRFRKFITYMTTEWFASCPRQFLRCYTKQYFHIDETTTSRVEGAHWTLKRDLQVSNKDLFDVVQNMKILFGVAA
ncbi:uncharacterized protein N7515_000559 [Penicillium bovifimosum]|uniref:Uncharacterized protein n=1 Tax=Penicillium bovifimosum TaxID=126998 RepID=A0A9W9HHL6_9EURO|nr:uncharacterized protein N7515_000559 [Penicillium bovifimosum]KAJ5145995.1 hypothetical protein N7515_000559 [Penicillium bovifimosum]